MLIDSHAHLNFDEYKDELGDVIQRSFNSNTQIISIGANFESSQKAIAIAEQYPGIWAVVGCHPDELSKSRSFEPAEYLKLAKSSPKVVGIGEVGLDFFRLPADSAEAQKIKDLQVQAFKEFIKLSRELSLPLVFHARNEPKEPCTAYDLMLEILSQKSKVEGQKLTGVIHCFGGNLVQAKKFIDLGLYIGFTGIVTFKNAKELQAIAKEIPLDKILVETDAPFLAPEPNRGQRNEPSYVKFVAQKIAELKGISFEEVENTTYENTVRLFNLK